MVYAHVGGAIWMNKSLDMIEWKWNAKEHAIRNILEIRHDTLTSLAVQQLRDTIHVNF